MEMVGGTAVARVVFTMALLSISKACFHFKCSPDVGSMIRSMFCCSSPQLRYNAAERSGF